jgi:hypothetical protein
VPREGAHQNASHDSCGEDDPRLHTWRYRVSLLSVLLIWISLSSRIPSATASTPETIAAPQMNRREATFSPANSTKRSWPIIGPLRSKVLPVTSVNIPSKRVRFTGHPFLLEGITQTPGHGFLYENPGKRKEERRKAVEILDLLPERVELLPNCHTS